jgi:hypothetical protein
MGGLAHQFAFHLGARGGAVVALVVEDVAE